MKFSKILVARYSPENKCYAPDGAVLTVKPLAQVPMKDHVPHYFTSVTDPTIKSRYGWVKEVDPFSLDDFVARYTAKNDLTAEEREHLEVMFTSIAKLAPETPVAATYSCRGVERRRMQFTVHRVIFYKA